MTELVLSAPERIESNRLVPADDDGVERLRDEVTSAVDTMVDTLLQMRADIDALKPDAAHGDSRQTEIADLGRRLDNVRAHLERDRMRSALSEASRHALKTRSIVFVGRHFFGDNLKYAYLAALGAAERLGFECWYLPFERADEPLVQSLGGRCLPADYREWSSAHVDVALSAAVLVVCDQVLTNGHPNPFATSLFAGARWVQLWHGISIKEVGLKNPAPLGSMTAIHAELLASCGRYASFIGSSAAAESDWRRWFGFQRYAPIGYPRSDVMRREPSERDLVNVDLAVLQAARETIAAGARVMLYVPTFRDAKRGTWLFDIGLGEMHSALAARGDRLIVNLHPLEARWLPALRERFPQIGFVAALSDIYPLLRHVSVLVTDYSSLMFDFLPMQRPIVFFRPDHDDYVATSRQLFDGKVATLPGPVCTTTTTLIEVLQGDAAQLSARHAAVREELRQRLFEHDDGAACDRLLSLLDDEMRRATGGAELPRA